jgi:AraC-like DNA-binding protein
MITRHARGANLLRHRHAEPYLAVVLAGGYVEAGDGGRWRAGPGTVMVHGAHEAHRDSFDAAETVVLNLPVPAGLAPATGLIDDIDAIARIAERDPSIAAALAATMLRPGAHRLDDWPDLLADALVADPALALGDWADAMGLAPASVSRGFARAYGVSPKRYRLEARTRHALHTVAGSRASLAEIAAAHGFADQAHMTRALVALTGMPPGALRAKSVQAGAATPL